MKFNSLKLSLLLCTLAVNGLFADKEKGYDLLDENNDILLVSDSDTERVTQTLQTQMSELMNTMYELVMPDYKKIYKKYYVEIEWVEHNYVVNRAEGDIIINKIAVEFQNVILDKLDNCIDIILVQLGETANEDERAAFKNLMAQMMPMVVTQGLMKNAELKSSVYQEIMADSL